MSESRFDTNTQNIHGTKTKVVPNIAPGLNEQSSMGFLHEFPARGIPVTSDPEVVFRINFLNRTLLLRHASDSPFSQSSQSANPLLSSDMQTLLFMNAVDAIFNAFKTTSQAPMSSRERFEALFHAFCRINYTSEELSKKQPLEIHLEFCEIHHVEMIVQAWEEKLKKRYSGLKFADTPEGGVHSFWKSYQDFSNENYTAEEMLTKPKMERYVHFCWFNDTRLYAQKYWEEVARFKYADLKIHKTLNVQTDCFVQAFEKFWQVNYKTTTPSEQAYSECFQKFCEILDTQLFIQKYWEEVAKFKYLQLKLYKTCKNSDELFFLQSFEHFRKTKYTAAELKETSLLESFSDFCQVNDEKVYVKEWLDKIRSLKYLFYQPVENENVCTFLTDIDAYTISRAGGTISIGGGGTPIPGQLGLAVNAGLALKAIIDAYRASGGGDKDKKKKEEKEKEKKEQEENLTKALAKHAQDIAFKNGFCVGWDQYSKLDLPAVDPKLQYYHSALQRIFDLSSLIPGSNDRIAIVNGKIIKFTPQYQQELHVFQQLSVEKQIEQLRLPLAPRNYVASVVTDLNILSKNEKESLRKFWGFDVKQKLKELTKQQRKNDANKISNSGPDKDPKDDKKDSKKIIGAVKAAKDELDSNLCKSVEDLLKDTVPGRETTGRARQYIKNGNYEDAVKDFHSLKPSDIQSLPGKEGLRGRLPDGRDINVRLESTVKIEGCSAKTTPTIEIMKPGGIGIRIKIRYHNKL